MKVCSNEDAAALGFFRQLRVALPMRSLTSSFILAASLVIASCGPRNQDRLSDNELVSAQAGTKSAPIDDRCTRRATTDEVRSQLFARAAQIRGSNGDTYANIAGYALIELDGAMPTTPASTAELVDCKGHATLRLPTGLKVAGGRTSLGGDVSYSVAPGARGTVTLGQSDAIAIPLATLTKSRAAPPQASTNGAEPRAPQPVPPVMPLPARRPQPVSEPANAALAARPSFDCRNARTASERTVCSSPALAALDRDMAAQYRGAIANGGPEDRRLLAQTRDRFLMYRDRCGTDQCIAATYRGRMREISDIVAGRWQGSR